MEENTDREIQSLSNSVECLFLNGLLTDIECRKIACTKDLDEKRAAIYQILKGKNEQVAENILNVFRCNIHPLINSSILERVFSFLCVEDLRNCYFVCQKWNVVTEALNKKRRNPHHICLNTGISGHIVKDEEDSDNLLQFRQNLFEKIKEIKTANDDLESQSLQVQALVFNVLLSNHSLSGEIVREIFQHVKEIERSVQITFGGQSCSVEDDEDLASCNLTFAAKALQNDAILNRLFQFLPFKDIQNCRMVSRQWNSVAEPFVIKRGRILFTFSFGPGNFTEAFRYSNVPNLSFNAFKFTNGACADSELEDFFSKWGPIIQHIHLGYMRMRNIITSGLSHTSNLKTFQFHGDLNHTSNIELLLPWSKFHSVQCLDLECVVVNADIDIIKRKIQPLKINLHVVRFAVDGELPVRDLQIYFNDYVDFSKARDINITGTDGDHQRFNWATDVINAERVTIENVKFENLPKRKSSVDFLSLCYCSFPFSRRNHLEIKQLMFQSGKIELSALPSTLQKLCLRWDTEILVSQPIDLPFLEFLSFRKGCDFHEITHFKNCPKLVDMEILGISNLDVTLLPRNIKRIKLQMLPLTAFDFVGDEPEYIELDLLSFDFVSTPFLNKTMTKVRPKVLAFTFRGVYEDNFFVGFLRRNNHVQKMYVQFRACDLSDEIFEGSVLSTLVARKSFFYEFSNESGKAISQEEFKTVQSQVDTPTAMSEFWND